jgi:predicted transcriptional regulator
MTRNHSLTINLEDLKREYARKAEFISYENVQFNMFDNSWELAIGRYTSLVWVDQLFLNVDDNLAIRYCLAQEATYGKISTVRGKIVALKKLNVSSLSAGDVESAFFNLSLSYKKRVKKIIERLADFDDKYEPLLTILKDKSFGNDSRKVFDPDKGALTDYEFTDFAIKMNEHSSAIFHSDSQISELAVFITVRFQQLYQKRLAQVALLKVGDFELRVDDFIDGEELRVTMPLKINNYDIEQEIAVRVPSAKQHEDLFRRSFEISPIRITGRFLFELSNYLSKYQSTMRELFDLQGYSLSKEEFSQVFSCLPLIPKIELYKTDFKKYIHDNRTLIQSFSIDGKGFVYTGEALENRVSRFLKLLNVGSDRAPQGSFALGNNRLRHTRAVKMVVDGLSRNEIAIALGNTPKAASVYIDMADEIREKIDSHLSDYTFLADAFSGKITSLVDNNEIAIESESGRLGKSAEVGACLTCEKSPPAGCYGCPSFRPLVDADHLSQLLSVQARYDSQVANGISPKALTALSHRILAIKATIQACECAKVSIGVSS